MEGFREPDSIPKERPLEVCAIHGLSFDPAEHAACIVCRRESSRAHRSRIVKVAIAVAVVGGLIALALMANAKRGVRDGPCTSTFGCGAGLDCMSVGIVPGESGTCYARCDETTACGAGNRCVRGHCFAAAAIGDACGAAIACPDNAECLALGGQSQRCVQTCIRGSTITTCPQGMSCESVDVRFAPALPTSFTMGVCVIAK